MSPLLYIMKEFKTSSNGSLRQEVAANHLVNVRKEERKPIPHNFIHAGLRHRKSEETEIYEMMAVGIIKPPKTGLCLPNMLAPKKYIHTNFHINYKKLNFDTVCDSYSI